MKRLLGFVPFKYRPLVYPVVVLVCLVVVVIVSAPYGYGKVMSVRGEIADSEKRNRALEEKVNILSNVSADATLDKSSDLLVAVPSENPSLLVASQLKQMVVDLGLVMTDLKLSAAESSTGKLALANIDFTLLGDIETVIEYVRRIEQIAPLTNVEKISFTVEGGSSVTAEMKMKSYWSSLPTKITDIDKPVTGLTPVEEATLGKLVGLNYPEFNFGVSVATVSGRVNPFSF